LGLVGETLARHLSLIGDLPDDDRQALSAIKAEVRELKRRTDILSVGERPQHSVIVLSGLLYRYTLAPQGTRQIHSFYLPSDSPSVEALYLDYMDNNLGAVVDSQIGLIPLAELDRIVGARHAVRKLVVRDMLVQAATFREWLMRNSKMPAHASLAHFFCEIFLRARAAGLVADNTCALPITQELLGDAVGLTAVHTNRTLMVLRETGAVEWRSGRLRVMDWDKLAEIGDFDPRYLHLRNA
jgi:CRP-like cAMP-binding protein